MNLTASQLLERASEEERSGNWAAAVLAYEALYQQHSHTGDMEGLLDAIVRLGHCHRQAGRPDVAADEFELALALAEVHDNDRLASRALNGLGQVAQGRGDLRRAEEFYTAAQERSERVPDLQLLGEAAQNLGIIANIRGDLIKAAEMYHAGLRHLEAAGSVRGQIATLNNLGMLHVDLGRLDEAEDYFGRALALCQPLGDIVYAGIIHVNRAELFLARGELDRARESCDEGFEVFSRLNHALRKAEALKFYGVIYRESGKLHLAEIHLRQAIEIASHEDPLLEAEAQREMARVRRAQGHNRGALEALNRSHALFTRLQAQAEQADIDKRITELEGDFLSLVRFWARASRPRTATPWATAPGWRTTPAASRSAPGGSRSARWCGSGWAPFSTTWERRRCPRRS